MNVRREFSARTKRQAWERANGFCEAMWPIRATLIFDTETRITDGFFRCNTPLERGRFVYEHLCPDWFSKDNELENCAVYCLQCAKAKTRTDVKNIAKSKRIIDKRIKAKSKRGFRGWRNFRGEPVWANRK